MSLRAEIIGRYNDVVDELRSIEPPLSEGTLLQVAEYRVKQQLHEALDNFMNERREHLAERLGIRLKDVNLI